MKLEQRDRVLVALKGADARGITAVDFLNVPTIDAGPPITRLAARIKELRDEGHTIVADGPRRDKCVVYRLSAVLPAAPPSPGAPVPGDGSAPSPAQALSGGAADKTAGQLFTTARMEFDAMVGPASPYDDTEVT